MKTLKILNVLIVILSLTMSEAYAAVPEMPFLYKEAKIGESAKNESSAIRRLSELPWANMAPEQMTPAGMVAHFTDFVQQLNATPAPSSDDVILETTITGEDLIGLGIEAEVDALGEGTLEIAGEKSALWNKRNAALLAALFLLVGLGVGFAAILGGGGSGSGGSGSDGSGGGGGGLPGGGGKPSGPGGGGGGNTGGGGPFGNIPNNPEPSTFILAGLGLLIPLLRRKKVS